MQGSQKTVSEANISQRRVQLAAKPKFVVTEELPVATARSVPLNAIILPPGSECAVRAREERKVIMAAIDRMAKQKPPCVVSAATSNNTAGSTIAFDRFTNTESDGLEFSWRLFSVSSGSLCGRRKDF
ncbi:hypothetical protein CFAM422_012744 [Trichoderma lentiforme]|uniref:Uncharacterized protein n=1 Tax=Trichoderma lentiforme TaxID=1567552 RepID=A0A9P5C6A4_9HYPO|nr:hypothetical protein CFAM422_012744 [Trichoderma lentiforme]